MSGDRHRRSRANGEGSIYPYRNGSWAGYVWVTTPDGERKRDYIYGQSREEVHAKWLKLHRREIRAGSHQIPDRR